MRKFGLLGAVVVLAAAFLAGCGAKTDTGVVDAKRLKPYDLLWYMRGRGPEKDQELVQAEANKYLKDKINATIRIVNVDRAAFPERMTAVVASGEAFDMTFTASWVLNYNQFAQKGAFVALNDPKNNLQEKYLKKTVELLGEFYYGGSTINGLHYAVPVNKEWAHSYGYEVRKDIMDKYNMDLSNVKTIEEMEPFFQTIKDKEPGMIPVQAVANNSSWAIVDWDYATGDFRVPAVMYQHGDDMKVYNALELPESLKYFETARRWYLKGFVRKDGASTEDYTPDLASGKTFASLGTTHPGQRGEMEAAFGFPFYEVNLTQPSISNGETMGAMTAISITSKDPARAAMFLELENTDPYLNNLIAFGIEGTHWVKTSTGQIDFPAGVTATTSGYVPAISWAFGNQFLNYLWTSEPADKWERYLAYNKSASPAKTLGFLMDLEPIKTEIAAVNNVWAEFMPGLEVGSSDPAVYVPRALAKFKEAGIDKIIAETQRQFDAWRAKK